MTFVFYSLLLECKGVRLSRTLVPSVDMSLSKLQDTVEDRGAWCAAVHGITKSRTRLSERLLPSAARSSLILLPPVFPFSQTFFMSRDQAPQPYRVV